MSYNTALEIFCDDCGHGERFDGCTLAEARKKLRKNGWKTTKAIPWESKAKDICPECRKKATPKVEPKEEEREFPIGNTGFMAKRIY